MKVRVIAILDEGDTDFAVACKNADGDEIGNCTAEQGMGFIDLAEGDSITVTAVSVARPQ